MTFAKSLSSLQMYAWSYGGSADRKYELRNNPPPMPDVVRAAPPPPANPPIPPRPVREIDISDLSRIQKILDKDGVVIVNNVLSPKEIDKGLELFWKAMGQMSPLIKRDEPSTWRNQNWPRNFSSGMIQEGNFAGSEFMWYARTRPNLLRVFEVLLETPDLIVSLDTARVVRGHNTSHTVPLHVDQHLRGAFGQLVGFQSAIQFTDVCEFDAGFTVVPGSHKEYEMLFGIPEVEQQSGNHIVLPARHHFHERAVKPCLKKGSVVVWNMRTAHGVAPSKQKTALPSSHHYTLSAFVSYFPRRMRFANGSRERLSSARSGTPNTHWAVVSMAGNTPRPPRPRGSREILRIDSFYAAHEDRLSKWI